MASLPLTTDQRNRLVSLLAGRGALATRVQRQAMLDAAGLRALEVRLSLDAHAYTFASQLLRVAEEHGTQPSEREGAPVRLLRWLRDEVAGHEADAAFVDELLTLPPRQEATLSAGDAPLPPAPRTELRPTTRSAERERCEAEAARRARNKVLAALLVLGLVWLALFVAGLVLLGWDVLDPLITAISFLVLLGGYAFAAVTLQELSPLAFMRVLIEREQKGCEELGEAYATTLTPPSDALSVGPAANQRAAEAWYIAHRLSAEVEERYSYMRPDLYVEQEGSGEVAGIDPLLRAELDANFRHFGPTQRSEEIPPREHRHYSDILGAVGELRRVVLLGEPGAGKTTTLRKIEVRDLIRAREELAAPIPLFVPLGEWTEPNEPLPLFMARQCGPLGPWLPSLLSEERASLLLDGLDQIPPSQRGAKGEQIRDLFQRNGRLIAVVSCREQDYERDLGFDQLLIEPLSAERILAFARRYLWAKGPTAGDDFFWSLAGNSELSALWGRWQAAGGTLNEFWPLDDERDSSPWMLDRLAWPDYDLWQAEARSPSALMRLASNPYLLGVMLALYSEHFTLTANRAKLLEAFVRKLIEREARSAQRLDVPWPGDERVLAAGERIAWAMQGRRQRDEDDARTTLTEAEARRLTGNPAMLPLLQGAQLLTRGDPLRFQHQLLQEYLVARGIQKRQKALWPWLRLHAEALWPRARWWERTGWEEATVLLAGLYPEGTLRWVSDANPLVAAECLVRSGAAVTERIREGLREGWKIQLTDIRREPSPASRAAIGRALDVAGLDNRPGVGVRADGMPDIAWVRLKRGDFPLGGDERAYAPLPNRTVTVEAFSIARYPVTNAQWGAFLNAPDGYEQDTWWRGLAGGKQQPARPHWREGNRPRENVNGYEAVAFCRWLSSRLGYEVRLPREEEWERAARGAEGRIYPWGPAYVSGYANIDETDTSFGNERVGPHYLRQTSAVGIYPQGATPEGVHDLAGNVWEWTITAWEGEGGSPNDNLMSTLPNVLRGGSWGRGSLDARAASRDRYGPDYCNDGFGFRVVALAPAVL